jgi:hypothetical protein
MEECIVIIKKDSFITLTRLILIAVLIGVIFVMPLASPGDAFGGEIISFEPLAPEVSEQTVPYATDISELVLPGTLKAGYTPRGGSGRDRIRRERPGKSWYDRIIRSGHMDILA